MDLIYSVNRKRYFKSSEDFDSLHEGNSLCVVSSKNIIAFTTRTELDDSTAKTWGSHVYVADLNIPWYSHKVLFSAHEVTALEWDLSGHKLLVADANGTVGVWTFKEYILNDWQKIGETSFLGERIISAAFFHNGKKISLVAEKKDSVLYSDKFSHVRFAPSVKNFGGRPIEGCIVISATGLIGVIFIPSEDWSDKALPSTAECLGSTRHSITAADICYGKNGDILVAVSSGNVKMPIQCYRVSVTYNGENCLISSQALPSFFLQASPASDKLYKEVTQLKFVLREDADSLVVAVNGDSGSLIEIWELMEKSMPIHNLFQTNSQSLDSFKTVLWQHQSYYRQPVGVSCITTCKVSVTTSVPPPSYVVVAYADGSIHCLYRDTLKQVASTTILAGRREDDVKLSRISKNIAAMDLTWLSSVLIVTDRKGQIYIYKLHPIAEPGGMNVQLATTLLEYCLVTGLDWWHLLISLRPLLLDAVCERLTENFNRQPSSVQQYHYVTYLTLKSSLYRLSPSSQARAADLTALLMLHSISAAFKSLLRPSDLASYDKVPGESLQNVMSESGTDVDSVLVRLEGKKEFTVEPSNLQSLQQLIQWVADLALNLLARLPEQRRSSGYELIHDYKAVNCLRELLVIIRIWGLVRDSCLPVFSRSTDNLDVLALLYKLLSRLVQSPEPDDTLIDDCCLLPSQVMIPPLNTATSITAITSPNMFYQSQPIHLEYGVEPESLHFIPEISSLEGSITEQTVDTIRHVYLGKSPLLVKLCCRCGGKAQIQSCVRTPAIRAWDQRWARACRCGGHWRIHKKT